MSKVLIAVLRDKKVPGKSAPDSQVPLETRVRYALNCIQADMPSKKKAIEFLTKAKGRIDNPELLSQVEEALQDGT